MTEGNPWLIIALRKERVREWPVGEEFIRPSGAVCFISVFHGFPLVTRGYRHLPLSGQRDELAFQLTDYFCCTHSLFLPGLQILHDSESARFVFFETHGEFAA